jgi:hypothetical protein
MVPISGQKGVKVMFTRKGLSSKCCQPLLKADEKEVLRAKIRKFVERKYIAPPSGQIRSLIKYFAIPKGLKEWRIVFHAGANKLNDSVWAPSFCLPTVNSLLRIVDERTLMQDMDVGEMFLNFQLHPNAIVFAAVDLGPLEFTSSECSHRWMYWTRNLMGFRPSPYNSIRMYLIAEEVIRGDCHDSTNVFQWDTIRLNLPGTQNYKTLEAWLSKRRADGSLASNFVCFVDNLRVTGQGREQMIKAGHAISTREAWLGIQDALRKLRCWGGTTRPGAWAGASVCIKEDVGVLVLVSQDKWMRMKNICRHWLGLLTKGKTSLDFKQLRSDRGFMVYVTQAYPGLKPYLKGFHLSLEMWREDRDREGWCLQGVHAHTRATEESVVMDTNDPDKFKIPAMAHDELDEESRQDGPKSGLTPAATHFKQDLEAILHLTKGDQPQVRRVRTKNRATAYYGFGDAWSGGFGSTVTRPKGLHGRFGLWGKDEEAESSNYQELRNLVDTVEDEAKEKYLKDGELWLFTDNSTAESCFFKGGSSSKLLHDLILRLRKAEMNYGFMLHVVHVAGTRMIAQGTDGLSRGILLEGVVKGEDMLAFIDLSKTAIERHPGVLEFALSWITPVLGECTVLSVDEWFQEGHGIRGGTKNLSKI